LERSTDNRKVLSSNLSGPTRFARGPTVSPCGENACTFCYAKRHPIFVRKWGPTSWGSQWAQF